MTDKFDKLVSLLSENRKEITDIYGTNSEYYFFFRQKVFSVRRDEQLGVIHYRLYVYPRWPSGGDLALLAERIDQGIEQQQTVFVAVNADGDAERTRVVRDLYTWVRSQYLGLNELFDDLGI